MKYILIILTKNIFKRNLLERFINPAIRVYPEKSFVRGNVKILIIPSTYIPGINVYNFCNSNGEFNKFEKHPKTFIKHFYTKTVEEFYDRIKRGHVHFHKNHKDYQGSINAKLKKFFKLNKKTYEKVKILENCLKIKINID